MFLSVPFFAQSGIPVSRTSFHFSSLNVHLTQKYFFPLNKSLHLFERRCAFLLLLNPNLFQAVKITKSDHHLLHDWASKGYGSIPGLTSQTSLHACLQRLNTMQFPLWHQTRNRAMPLTSSVMQQMMARFRNFYSLSILSLKRCSVFRTGAKKRKKYFGFRCTLNIFCPLRWSESEALLIGHKLSKSVSIFKNF